MCLKIYQAKTGAACTPAFCPCLCSSFCQQRCLFCYSRNLISICLWRMPSLWALGYCTANVWTRHGVHDAGRGGWMHICTACGSGACCCCCHARCSATSGGVSARQGQHSSCIIDCDSHQPRVDAAKSRFCDQANFSALNRLIGRDHLIDLH